MSSALQFLSLCRRAGALTAGFDAVKEALARGAVGLVLTASDLSPKSRKEIAYFTDKSSARLLTLPAPIDDIARVMGKRTGIIGVSDPHMADKLAELITREESLC